MLITITGKAGSGKTTIAKALAERLGYEYISIGEMKRKIAQEMGLNILEFNKLGDLPENQHEFDLKYEEFQKQLSPDASVVLESRLGYFCQPNSFKLFVTVDGKEAAKRIFNNHRETDNYASREELYHETEKRNQEDLDRFQKLYNTNYQDLNNFDFVVDSTNKSVPELLEEVYLSYCTAQK